MAPWAGFTHQIAKMKPHTKNVGMDNCNSFFLFDNIYLYLHCPETPDREQKESKPKRQQYAHWLPD
jgi:hypothetical protein